MNQICTVNIVQGTQIVVNDAYDMWLFQLYPWIGSKQLLEISLHAFNHHEENFAISFFVLENDIDQLDSVLIVLHLSELSKYLNLSNDLFGLIIILEDIFIHLNCYNLPITFDPGLHDFTSTGH